MNNSYLYVGVMLAVLIATVVTLVSLAGSNMTTGSAKETPTVSKAAASQSRTPAKPVELTPVPVPTPESIEITYSCQKDYLTYETYASMEEVRALPANIRDKCRARQSLGEPNELEIQALESAYSADYKVDSLSLLQEAAP